MELPDIQDDPCLGPDDLGGHSEDERVDQEPKQPAQGGDHGGLREDGAEDRGAPRAEGAQDGELSAPLVHGVVEAREDRARSHDADEVGHEAQDLVRPADLVEELRHGARDGPGEGHLLAAVDLLGELEASLRALEAEHHGADLLDLVRDLFGRLGLVELSPAAEDVAIQTIHALERDPDHLVRGRIGGLEDADDDVLIVVVMTHILLDAMLEVQVRADAQACLARHLTADDGLHLEVAEDAAALHHGVAHTFRELELGEELRRRADDPIALVVVAYGVGDRDLHARVVAHLGVRRVGDVPRRGVEMQHAVHDELQLAPARAEDRVEAGRAGREGLVGLLLDGEDADHETAGERERARCDARRELVPRE